MNAKKTLILAASLTTAIGMTVPAHALSLGVDVDVDAGVDIGIGGGSEAGGSGDAGIGVGVGVGVDAEAGVTAEGNTDGTAEGDATATTFAEADADARVDMVIGLIVESSWDAATQLRDVATYTGTQAYNVGAWLTSETEARFEAAVAENMEAIANLRAAIQADASMSAWLAAENVDVNTVVALGVTADGELVAFTE